MPTLRGFAVACALVLALVALLAAPAAGSAATPGEIFRDYVQNGEITGDYSFDDLRAALETAREDALYGDFAGAVEDELDSSILGRTPDGGGADLGAVGEAAASPLPVPRTPDQSGDPPWPFLALTALAAALVLSGAGSSIYRRARR
jgi:hypothetical protein